MITLSTSYSRQAVQYVNRRKQTSIIKQALLLVAMAAFSFTARAQIRDTTEFPLIPDSLQPDLNCYAIKTLAPLKTYSQVIPVKTGGGNNDFNGKVAVNLGFSLYISADKRYVVATVSMTGRQTATPNDGTAATKTIRDTLYKAPLGYTILHLLGITSVSRSYVDADHAVDIFSYTNGPVSRIYSYGDGPSIDIALYTKARFYLRNIQVVTKRNICQ